MLGGSDASLIELLSDIDLFRTLDGAEIKEVLRVTEAFFLAPGERIFSEGASSTGLYVVERGEVDVRISSPGGPEVVLAHLGNGCVVGEMALIDGGSRSASVVAVSPAQGRFLSRLDFDDLQRRGRPLATKMILQLARTLETRIRQLEERFLQLRRDPEIAERLREKPTKELIARARMA